MRPIGADAEVVVSQRRTKEGSLWDRSGWGLSANLLHFPLDRLSKEELPDMLMRVTGDLLRHKDLFSKVRASGGRSDFLLDGILSEIQVLPLTALC